MPFRKLLSPRVLQPLARDRTGASYVEYLVLLAFLGLGSISAVQYLRRAVLGSAEHAAEKVVALEAWDEVAAPAAQPATSAALHTIQEREQTWLDRGLGLLGGAWDATVGRVPERVKPLIRHGAERGLDAAIQVGSKLLPDSIKAGALTKSEDALDWISRQVNGRDASLVPKPLQDAFKEHVPDNVRDKIHRVTHDLADVDLEAIRKTEGLEADWYKFYETWLVESRPGDPRNWDVSPTGHQRLTLDAARDDPRYARDLQSRPQHQQALDQFFREHPNPKPGDSSTALFEFTGDGTRENGKYTALEWYLGSYHTQITYRGQDPVSGKAILDIDVSNESDWQSGTRLPNSQEVAGRNYILPNTHRGGKLGIGGDFDQRFTWTQQVDLPPR